VARRETGHTHHVDVVFNGHFGRLFRRLEHRTDVHIKADIRIGRGHHLDPPVMAVLPHFGHQLAGAAAVLFQEFLRPRPKRPDHLVVSVFG